jgi:sterol desaturase/sphingolipid hydroxylase (fatty acid hydroxylase superfamily)
VHLLTSLALIGAAVLVTVPAVTFLLWLSLHWTWTVLGMCSAPLM